MQFSSSDSFVLPKVYPILDASFIPAGTAEFRAEFLGNLGRSLTEAGVTLLEYRNKPDSDAVVFADALILRAALPARQVKLILDDRVDVALAAGFDGVHVDAGDLPVPVAKTLFGSLPQSVIGTSAGGEGQLLEAIASGADYVAFGPVFLTTTKQTSAQPIGIEGVRRFREAAGLDAVLVAAAGITLETAPEILAAGANAVAVAAAIFDCANPAAEFRRWIGQLQSFA